MGTVVQMGKTGEADPKDESKAPTVAAQTYLEAEMVALEAFAAEGKTMDYHKHCLELLNKESNSPNALNKMLSTIEEDQEAEKLAKSDVLKLFAELCLVLKNAAQEAKAEAKVKKQLVQIEEGPQGETDERAVSKTPKRFEVDEYEKLFQRSERMKSETEYEEAKERGYPGDFDEYMTLMASHRDTIRLPDEESFNHV